MTTRNLSLGDEVLDAHLEGLCQPIKGPEVRAISTTLQLLEKSVIETSVHHFFLSPPMLKAQGLDIGSYGSEKTLIFPIFGHVRSVRGSNYSNHVL